MTRKKNILYIFLHIPKSAGSTFRSHIECNFNKDEAISVCWDEYLDLTRGGIRVFFTPGKRREQIDEYLSRLTNEQKDKIKILHGHEVYYGIHRFFWGREPRYITFLRHPIDREISMYNFCREHLENPSKLQTGDGGAIREKFIKEQIIGELLKNGKIISFEEWLKNTSWHNDLASKYLKRHGFATAGEPPQEMLKKFYFVGITENYQTDALFLYRLFGMRELCSDQNISKKYFSPEKLSKKLQNAILQRNTEDVQLYEYALLLNKSVGMRLVRFMTFCYIMRKTILLIVYDASFILRKHIPFYARLLDNIKDIPLLFKKV